MPKSLIAVGLLATAALATPGRPITPREAPRHRAELVTLTGTVTEVRTGPDGVILRIGSDPGVAVLVPEAARARFKRDLTELHRKRVRVTGFLTPPGRPLALALDRPEQLSVEPPPAPDGMRVLKDQVRALEDEAARMRPLLESGGETGVVYGPGHEAHLPPLPLYSTQPEVLAVRGVPTRVEWGPGGRVLYYGRERWTFDANGQLIDVRGR